MRQRESLLHIAFLLAALLACGGKSKSDAGAGDSPAEAAVDVPASTLMADYKGNEVRGDAKWKGKLVRVSGIIGDIKKDFTDSAYVTIGTGAEFSLEDVHCQLADGQEAKAANLTKGSRASFRGRVSGMIMLSVMMKDCELVASPAGAPPAAPAAPHPTAATPRPAPPPAAPKRR